MKNIGDGIHPTVGDAEIRGRIQQTGLQVSVVIAAYNVEKYIGRAIRSALDQEDVAVEVIVVDDGSTDGTAAVVTNIGDPRVKFTALPANAGPSVARNTAIDMAAAPWIAVLDGDDAFLPGRLTRCLSRAGMLDADIVADNLSVYREADGAEYPMFPPAFFSCLGPLTLEKFIAGNPFPLGNGIALGFLKPLFKTEFLRRHGVRYDPALRHGEDYLLMCEALAEGACCAIEPSAGYLYTVRAGSLSRRLTTANVARIREGDQKFLARHELGLAAARAQKRRDRGLREAYAFTKSRDALECRDIKQLLAAIAECPSASLHVWRPVWARAKRVFGRLERKRGLSHT